jgi:tetratricopeptide (TPR) repeat protein
MRKGKITVRRQLRQPDEFMKFSQRMLAYVKDHPWQVAALGGLLVVLLLGVVGSQAYVEHRDRQAARLLADMVAATAAESGAAKWDQVLSLAAELRERYGNTAAVGMGTYLEGVAQLRLKQYADARHSFAAAMETDDVFLSDLSRLGMATACFEDGAYEETLKALEPLHGGTVAAADVWLLTGLSCERLGRHAEALQAFEQVLQTGDRAPYHDWIAERVERLRLRERFSG